MRLPLQFAYDAVARIVRAATNIAPAGDVKFLNALADRRGVVERYQEWGVTGRDRARPLLWMHAPSVGEGLQARPVLQRVRQRRPNVQLAYTHFSPSAVSFARGLDVDFRDYLILDAPNDAADAIDALRPNALVFSKLDVWPNLVSAAKHRGVRLGLISATLAEGSSRRSGIARALLHDAYAALDAVGAIDSADAERLIALGARRKVIEVTGDARYDQVWERATAVRRDRPPVSELVADRPTIVAGSTWPSDEAVLLATFGQLHRSTPDLRLIIAPHEPSAAHLDPLLDWAKRERITVATLSDPSAGVADVVVVDRVGVLGDLYALATVAFVGGGFHDAGLHSVIEPAAFGAPVVFGPSHQMSRDALLLIASGGGRSVSDEREFVTAVSRWLKDPDTRRAAGESAQSLVRGGLGAADRSYAIVDALVG